VKRFHALPDDLQGILYTIASCFFASLLITLVRYLSQDFHIFFIVMVRNLCGLLLFVPQIIKTRQNLFATKRPFMHIYRGLNGLASMMVWFYVVSVLPLSEAVSVSFIIPIITTLAAIYFLKEKVKANSWSALFIGLLGILIILRPGFKEFNHAYIFSFISVILWVISNIIIKIMTRTEKPQTIVINMSLVMFVASIPFALPYLEAISFKNILWFIALGLISNLTHTCISNAYGKTDLALVQPFDFTRLIFTTIISYFVFGEVIDFWVIVGSLVILAGVVIVMPKRRKKKAEEVLDPGA
jgi:drug/metabolite transporter (DMT)-like permease